MAGLSGDYYHEGERTEPSAHVGDDQNGFELWEVSADLTGLPVDTERRGRTRLARTKSSQQIREWAIGMDDPTPDHGEQGTDTRYLVLLNSEKVLGQDGEVGEHPCSKRAARALF